MNYLAHGRGHLDEPYVLAGTAVPDWLNVVDRRVRARSSGAVQWVGCDDQRIADVARGVVQHHRDDDWFHRTRAFAELSWSFTRDVRDRLPDDDGLRPSFVGHILVEMLLDAVLIERQPPLLDRYYAALEEVDPQVVQTAVNRIAKRKTDQLAAMIDMFRQVRFLADYAEDERLFYRLGQVIKRVKLPALPDSVLAWLPRARDNVRSRYAELL